MNFKIPILVQPLSDVDEVFSTVLSETTHMDQSRGSHAKSVSITQTALDELTTYITWMHGNKEKPIFTSNASIVLIQPCDGDLMSPGLSELCKQLQNL